MTDDKEELKQLMLNNIKNGIQFPVAQAVQEINKRQIGGSHYNAVELQHWDFIIINDIPYLPAQITKYVTRWRKKHGEQDIEKAIHYLEKLRVSTEIGVLKLPERRTPLLLDEFTQENGIGHIEKTIFYLLTTYTTMDELYRVEVLLRHLLNDAQNLKKSRFEAPAVPDAKPVETVAVSDGTGFAE